MHNPLCNWADSIRPYSKTFYFDPTFACLTGSSYRHGDAYAARS